MGEQKRQYRVIWFREGREVHRHGDPPGTLTKDKPARYVQVRGTLKAAERLRLVLLGRGAEAYGLDPNAPSFCEEYEHDGCTTQARHYQLAYEARHTQPLVGEPVIEQREVGEWTPSDLPTRGD